MFVRASHTRAEPAGFAGSAASREGLARPSAARGWQGGWEVPSAERTLPGFPLQLTSPPPFEKQNSDCSRKLVGYRKPREQCGLESSHACILLLEGRAPERPFLTAAHWLGFVALPAAFWHASTSGSGGFRCRGCAGNGRKADSRQRLRGSDRRRPHLDLKLASSWRNLGAHGAPATWHARATWFVRHPIA